MRSTSTFILLGLALTLGSGGSLGCHTHIPAPQRPTDQVENATRFEALPVLSPVFPNRTGNEGKQRSWRLDLGQSVFGEVRVGPKRAAAIWLGGLEGARVRVVSSVDGERAKLRFTRLIGQSPESRSSEAELQVPGERIDRDLWYISQPPGEGEIWLVSADRACSVIVERSSYRQGRLIWETLEERLLAWIDGGGDLPELIAANGVQRLRATLIRQARLARAMTAALADDAAGQRALRRWRRAAALEALDQVRPLVSPYFSRRPLDRALGGPTTRLRGATLAPPDNWIDGTESRPYREIRSTALAISAPGWLDLEVRAPASDSKGPSANLILRVRRGRAIIREIPLSHAPAKHIVDPTQALPTKVGIETEDARPLGKKQRLRVPLRVGGGRYTIEVLGGYALARATHIWRREWGGHAKPGQSRMMTELRAGGVAIRTRPALPDDLLAALITRIAEPGHTSPKADAHAWALLATLWSPEALDQKARVTAIATAAKLLDSPASDLHSERNEPSSHNELRWALRLAAIEAISPEDHDAPRRIDSLLDGIEPPPEFLVTLAENMPHVDIERASKSLSFALIETARRAAPGDRQLRLRTLKTWWQRTRWRTIAPQRSLVPNGAQTPGESWILRSEDPAESTSPKSQRDLATQSWSASDRFRMGAGETWDFVAKPPSEPGRAPLLIADLAGISATTELRIDKERWSISPGVPPTHALFALGSGQHRIGLEGPPRAELFVSLPPLGVQVEPSRIASVRTYYPLQNPSGGPTRFSIPSSARPGPIRVELRLTHQAGPPKPAQPITLTLRSDGGVSRTIRLSIPEKDPRVVAEGDQTTLSRPVYALLDLPPAAEEIWLESQDKAASRLRIAIALRSDRGPEEPAIDASTVRPAAPLPPSSDDSGAASLRQLRGALRRDPDNLAHYYRLSAKLLEFGWHARARELYRYANYRDNRLGSLSREARVPALIALTSAHEAGTIERFPALGELETPVLITPASRLQSLPDEPEISRLQGDLRRIDAAVNPLSAGLVMAQLYGSTGAWQLGYEATALLRQALANCDDRRCGGSGPVLRGLSEDLKAEGVNLPRVRLAERDSALASGWQGVHGTQSNAGRMSLVLQRAPAETGSRAALGRALADVQDDDASTHLLRVGRAANVHLRVVDPITVTALLGCERARWRDPAAALECTFEVLIDGTLKEALTIGESTSHEFLLDQLGAGDHDVVIRFVRSPRDLVALVRYTTGRAVEPKSDADTNADTGVDTNERSTPLQIEGGATFFAASNDEAVTVRVAGPTTLHVELRRVGNLSPMTCDVRLAGAGDQRSITIDTLDERDPFARIEGHEEPVSMPVIAVLTLPREEPYDIEIRPRDGRVVTRLQQRVELGHSPLKSALPPREEIDRSTAPALTGLSIRHAVSWQQDPVDPLVPRLGTFSARTLSGTDDLGPRDSARLVLRQDLALDYRRGFDRRAWVLASSLIRGRIGSPLVFGTDLRALVQLPGRLRVGAGARFRGQRFPHDTGIGLAGDFSLMRPTPLGHISTLLPSLTLRARFVNFDDLEGDFVADSVDPQVYNDYSASHPFALRPALALRLRPRLDHVFTIGTDAVLNANFRSLDQASSSIRWRWLATTRHRGDILPSLGYRGGWRFADRDRSHGSWRHEAKAEIAWSMWIARSWRMGVALFDRVVFSRGFALSNVFGLSLRLDLHSGRRLRDMAPTEQEFDDIRGRRFWTEPEGTEQ